MLQVSVSLTAEVLNAATYWREDPWLTISLSWMRPKKSLFIPVLPLRMHNSTVEAKEAACSRHPGSHEAREAASLCRDTLTLKTHYKGGGHVSGGECPSQATSFGTRSHPPSLLLQPSSPSTLSVSLSGGCLCPRGVWECFGVFDRLNLAYWCKLHSIHNRHRDTLWVWL